MGLRSFPKKTDDGGTKYIKYDAFFEKRWRILAPSDIFSRSVALLDELKVPEAERFNLFYTVADCDDTKRGFKSQPLFVIDVDDVDHSKLNEYLPPVAELLGVTPSKVVVVSSGGGLHFILQLSTPICKEPADFETYRPQYKAFCKLLDRSFEGLGLRGKPDPSVFEPRRILRMPGTVNKKDGRADSSCVVLRGELSPVEIDLEKITGLKKLNADDAMTAHQVKRLRTADGKAAFEQCLFLAHCKEAPAAISEPEWYAAGSIIGRFKDGLKTFHEISKGHPGYSEQETNQKFEQAVENSGPRTCRNINSLWGECQRCPHFEKLTSPVMIVGADVIPTEATGFYKIWTDSNGVEKSAPEYADLLKAYKRDHHFLAATWLRSAYEYDGKKFVERHPLHVKAFAERMFNPSPRETMRNEFLAKVLVNHQVDREWFIESTAQKINFENGIYDVTAQWLSEHTPEVGFTWCLPYEYSPTAECPSWEKFIDDVCCGYEPSKKNLQEFLGYVVTGGRYKYHKALWLQGGGSNGKSTLVDVIKAVIGTPQNASIVSIKSIINDRFASAELFGKIANFCEETSPEDLSDTGPFKNLTGDGEVQAQRKFGEPFSFRNRAKLIMTYNEMPKLRDLSHGMLRRPLVIPLEAKFVFAHEPGPKKIDSKFVAGIFTELSGIFNWCIEGWNRLERQGHFTPNEKSDEALGLLKAESDSVSQWVEDFVTFVEGDGGETIATRALYEEYCKATPSYAVSLSKFGHRLATIPDFENRKGKFRKGDHQFKGFKGVLLRSKDAFRDKSHSQF